MCCVCSFLCLHGRGDGIGTGLFCECFVLLWRLIVLFYCVVLLCCAVVMSLCCAVVLC